MSANEGSSTTTISTLICVSNAVVGESIDWSVAPLSLVLCGYFIALVLLSQGVIGMKLGDLVALKSLSNLRARTRRRLGWILLMISVVSLCGLLYKEIDSSRADDWEVISFGVLLVIFVCLSVAFSNVSVLKIELRRDSEYSTATALRPVFLGGVAAILLGGIPFTLDHLLIHKFDAFQEAVNKTTNAKVDSFDFKATYQPKTLLIRQQTVTEDELFDLIAHKGSRILVKGRAGIGKTTLLTKMRAEVLHKTKDTRFIFFDAVGLDSQKSLEENLGTKYLTPFSCCSALASKMLLSHAIVVVDGLDEAPFADRQSISQLIERFSQSSGASIVVTTRPASFDTIPGFDLAVIQDLSVAESDRAMSERANLMLKRIQGEIAAGKMIDATFVRLVGEPDAAWSGTDKGVLECYRLFLSKFRFNRQQSDHYLFMSTFRDMDILQDIFLSSLFGRLALQTDSAEFGRTQLYEMFIKQRVLRNVRLDSPADESFASKVLEAVTELCARLYGNSHGSLSSFMFSDSDLGTSFQNTHRTLEEVLLNAEIIRRAGSNKFRFADHSLDDYFISRILRAELAKDSRNTQVILARQNFYSQTEVLPFLVGQYERVDFILSEIVKALDAHKQPLDLQRYMSSDFSLYLLHVRRTPENVKFLKSFDPSLPDILKIQAHAQINEYVSAIQ